MEKRGFDLKRLVWIAKRKTSIVTMERFCDFLDRLPLNFTFYISNISEDIDGYWVKEYLKGKEPDKKRGHYAWHNKTNDKYLLNASFFVCKDQVLDAIEKVYDKSKGLTKKKLDDLYNKQNKSLGDIAKEYRCSKWHISNIMKKYGLIRRTQSKARIEAIKKGKFARFEYHDINENFFSEWSPEMAWLLGLLFTDGTIDNKRVAICSVDIELLEKIKKLFSSSKPIQKRTQSYDKSKHIYEFTFFREKMRKDLNRLGLHERKSLNMIFPNVPQEYMRHFIRGCWDGDGSVFISGGKMNANYTCGSLNFIESLAQELYKVGVHKRRLPLDKADADRMWSNYPIGKHPLAIHKENRSKSYYIKIDSKDNLEKLFNYLYDGVDESMYLERKFKIFAKGLGVITNGLVEI